MEAFLAIATILGGVAAVWYFWDKIVGFLRGRREPEPPVPVLLDASPVEKWVDLKYPSDSGLLAKLEKVGFKVAWCSDRILARRIDLEGWEVVLEQDAQGVQTMYKLKDRPSDQTLIKKRL